MGYHIRRTVSWNAIFGFSTLLVIEMVKSELQFLGWKWDIESSKVV